MARKAAQAHSVGGQQPAAAARQLKRSAWTGVRARQWGGWAVEIRVPLSRQRLWVGAFETDRQAALAYDAAIFCFYGEDLPRNRRFNFPAAPRPDIGEVVRARLSVAAKDIANRHARLSVAAKDIANRHRQQGIFYVIAYMSSNNEIGLFPKR
ncbi:ethylene-responsive transcription factor ERF017-like [Panicum hallii]|uniref:ethylene-responsive transcription factor ERF017-like n=1 Tax=Panicum hallii TaxID=206008 RepID=UPI000DF4F147|nr:ethylene-responsive transcription factor ERF017-like [Panicum hallii]